MARNVSQLKNRARREEQRENWDRAIELYGEALRLSEASGDASLDLSLYNRIGDLYRRQGDVDQAIRHYLEAVDRYADQGLHTGAIALCNKIRRLDPERSDVYRDLGRLYAATGLLAEARSSFGTYLERMEAAGDGPACRDARLQLARLTGDRELLFEVTAAMAEAGGEEKERALEALLRLREEAGGEGEDDEIRRHLLDLAPDAELDADAREAVDGEGEPDPEEAPAAGDGPEARSGGPAGGQAGPALRGEGHVDLGERIRRRLGSGSAPDGGETGAPAGEHDFDGMLVGFRVEGAGGEGDADPGAHLELGVALRQMGLLEDAIREFQAAIRSPEPPLRAFELLGEAFIEQGVHGVAVRVLTRALRLPGRSDHELLGILHQLGVAHQNEGDPDRALDCFERVYSIDIDFRDVTERMEAARQAL